MDRVCRRGSSVVRYEENSSDIVSEWVKNFDLIWVVWLWFGKEAWGLLSLLPCEKQVSGLCDVGYWKPAIYWTAT